MQVNNSNRVQQQLDFQGNQNVSDAQGVDETGLFEEDAVGEKAEKSDKTSALGIIYGSEYKDFDLDTFKEAQKSYRHFIATMPTAGQASPKFLEKLSPIFESGEKINTKFVDDSVSIMDEYVNAANMPNVNDGYLKAVLARCQNKMEKEAEKVQIKFERLTIIAQTCMMAAVMELRAKEGGVSPDEIAQNMNDAAKEVEKHEVTEQEIQAHKNKETNEAQEGENTDAASNDSEFKPEDGGIDMQKQLAQIEKKISSKQKIIDDPSKSDFEKKRAQNGMNVLLEVQEMYLKLQNGEAPEVLAPPLETLA